MMKKKIAVLLSALVMLSAVSGCKNDSSSPDVEDPFLDYESETISIPDTAPTPEEDDEDFEIPGEDSNSNANDVDADYLLQDIREEIAFNYGENYIPSMPLEEQQLREVYGINMDNVEAFVAEGPMMSAHVDTYLSFKAVEGKGEEVEKDLIAYQAAQQENALQYPMNLAKVSASQVVRHGDYVFFVMLGAFDDRGDVTEEEQLTFAQEQTKIGVDVINQYF